MNQLTQNQKSVSVIALNRADADAVLTVINSIGLSSNEFSSVDEFMNAIDLVSPSCIVVCAGNQPEAANDFQAKITQHGICTAAIIVITDVSVRNAVKFMEQGAMTVLTSGFAQDELRDYLNSAVEKNLECEGIRKRVEQLESYRNSLSERQLKILNMVEQGHSNRQIANWFDLSQRTIELERARLMSTFESASLAQLVSKWTELRVLTRKWHPTDQVNEQSNGNVLDA